MDHALLSNGFGLNYNLGEGVEERATSGSTLLKLHGSINWGKCQQCKNIIEYPIREMRVLPFQDMTTVYLDFGSKINKIKHCDKPLENIPIIIPPTWNKTQYSKNISSVWKKASKELASAENIFIIGYSLPDSDMFFRYLYSLGVNSRTIIKNLIVINPDAKVDKKFENLFGGMARQKYKFLKRTFEESFDNILDTITST